MFFWNLKKNIKYVFSNTDFNYTELYNSKLQTYLKNKNKTVSFLALIHILW